jgi:integrase
VQLLLLTAQRRNEVAHLQWDHLDLAAGKWVIPATLTKNGEQQNLPLSPAAIAILENAPRMHDRFIFPARGNDETCFSGFGKCKARLDAMINIPNWTLHDLRRTAATGMAGLGVSPHVVERILNHTGGTLGGVAGIYNRFNYQDEMRDALDRWATRLTASKM